MTTQSAAPVAPGRGLPEANHEGDNVTTETTPDTLPEWLYQRFARNRNVLWEDLPDDTRSYWAHEAAAVRRAVARNGFKAVSSGGAR